MTGKIGVCAHCGGEYTYVRKRANGTCSDACRQNLRRARIAEEAGQDRPMPTPFALIFSTHVLRLSAGIAHIRKLTTQSRWKVYSRSADGASAKAALVRQRDSLDALIAMFPDDVKPSKAQTYEPSPADLESAMAWWDERIAPRVE